MVFSRWLNGLAGRILGSRKRVRTVARRGFGRRGFLAAGTSSLMAAPQFGADSSGIGGIAESLESRALLTASIDALVVDTGVSNSDFITSNTSFNLNGTGGTPSSVQDVFRNTTGAAFTAGDIIGAVAVASNGDFTFADSVSGGVYYYGIESDAQTVIV
ncbi:MAG: hypothetical protein FD138_705, partial [Planctomycetota bacterium]